MHVLVVEPFDGGSHRNFLDGWLAHSRHRFTRLSLPGKFWKWRMRHGAATLADQAAALTERDDPPAAVVGSSMLNLAEFRGVVPAALAARPMAIYFHENQFAYPDRRGHDRDRHFALTNLTSALAANAAWFNSAFNRDSMLAGIDQFLKQMPTRHLKDAPGRIDHKSHVLPPGIESIEAAREPSPGPLHIGWVARWEHDKNPEDFFHALDALAQRGQAFSLSVLGESFRQYPEIFDWARTRFSDRLVHFGYRPSRAAYIDALRQMDVVVSTARHEFFGLAVMEAAAAGCIPVLPNRLVYPELFDSAAVFYEGDIDSLTETLAQLAEAKQRGRLNHLTSRSAVEVAARYHWPSSARRLDEAVESLVGCYS